MDSFKSRVRKAHVWDDRLIQKAPVYAINRGCQELKMNVIPASSSSASNIQCLIQPPSYRTMVDRYISISTDIMGFFDVTLNSAVGANAVATGTPIFVFGRDGAPCAFPLHQGCLYNMDVEINDQKFSIDSQQVNQYLLRMMNSKKLAMERTCPNALDKLVNYNDGYATGSGINVLGTYYDSVPSESIANGAFPIFLTDANGNVLSGNNDIPIPATNGNPTAYKYNGASGQIVTTADITGTAAGGGGNPPATAGSATFRVYYKLNTTEALICPPLVFDELFYKESSLFEIKNIQVDMNIRNSGISIIRAIANTNSITNLVSVQINNQGLNSSATATVSTGAPFSNCRFVSYFLTPPVDVSLPSECVVPYMEYIRTQTAGAPNLASLAQGKIVSSVIPLAGVGDKILIAVSPDKYQNAPSFAQESNWNLQINSVTLDYGNKQVMLSTLLPQDLYKLAVQNGLQNTDWLQWNGQAVISQAGVTKLVPTVGSLIILTPGIDFPLEEGLVSGCPVRTTMQVTVNYTNQSAWTVNPVLTVINCNSGFVRFMNGESVIEKFPVSPAEVLGGGENIPSMQLKRLVGAGVHSNFNHRLLHKAHHKFKKYGGATPHSAGASHTGGEGGAKRHSKKQSKRGASRRAY